MNTIELKVPSIVCEVCANNITKAIKNVDSDAKININLDTKIVSVEGNISDQVMKETITNIGHTFES